MIPAVHRRGTNVARLLGYLFGPGRREEHENPHLVAAWTGAGPLADLEPPISGTGRPDVRRLADLLNQPVRAGLKPPPLTVWHTSIRTHPTDRVLTDKEWGHIAAEVMNAVGLARHGDDRAVRWLAVRHAEDHIHLVATLVRQDRRTAWGWQDKLNTQRICRELEEHYDLYRVAPPGQGSRRWPTPAEWNKTTRLNQRATTTAATAGASRRRRQVPPREHLRRQVRRVAAAATGEADFFTRLEQAGVKVRVRYSVRRPGEVTGYAVGMDGHVTAEGATVWYGGGKLAADPTLPKLRTRWDSPAMPPEAGGGGPARTAGLSFPPAGVYSRAEKVVRDAAAALRATRDPAQAAGIAQAAADLLTTAAHRWEGRRGGPLSQAAELFDRVVHDQRVHTAGRDVHAARLRGMARLIALTAATGGDNRTAAVLFLTMAGFIDAMADLRQAQQRLHQVHAARDAAQRLRSWTPPPAAAVTAPAAPGSRSRLRPAPRPGSSASRHQP